MEVVVIACYVFGYEGRRMLSEQLNGVGFCFTGMLLGRMDAEIPL
jgi:hypothetical protein